MLVTKQETNIYIVLISICLLLLVIFIGLTIYLLVSRQRKYILKKLNDEMKIIKMNVIADAKKEASAIKKNAELEAKYLKEQLNLEEINLKLKKEDLYKNLDLISKKEESIIEEKLNLNKMREDLKLEKKEVQSLLENISHLSELEVKEELFSIIKNKYMNEFSNFIKDYEERLIKRSYEKASRIIIDAMQSVHIDITTEKNTTFFEIEDDSWKGRIIGKDGRNIKTFQNYGGVDILIDDTPKKIIISSFNPLRREVAYLTLKELTKSISRLTPAIIEEQLIAQNEKIEKECYEIGLQVAIDLKVDDLPDEILTTLGKLKYRFSYGQNALQHSLEVGQIARNIAKELNLDEEIALKAGLLHDIGKAISIEKEGSHVTHGVNLLKKYNLDYKIINAVEAHHNDVDKETFYAEIVAIADGISAARPGARNNDFDNYLSRMTEIENVCLNHKGVARAYVLKAGREIRVMVNPTVIGEYAMKELLYKLRDEIQVINKAPGDVYITVIREKTETIKL